MFLIGTVATIASLLVARAVRRRLAPRTAREESPKHLPAPDAPPSTSADEQRASDGVGPLLHRHYEVDVSGSSFTAASLMQATQAHLAELSPALLAEFTKSVGDNASMRVGDEYDITMLGPWNGRVRVADVSPTEFTLVTCDGHPEAGHIVFRVLGDSGQGGSLQMQIDSWARARDAAVDLAYGALGIGQDVQTEVWVTFLQRVAALAGVSDVPEVRVTTEELVD